MELPIVNGHLRVKVKPNARTSVLLKIDDGIAYLAIAAPPEDGKANAEIERYLSKLAGRKARIKSGFSGKEKLVQFT